MKIDKKKWFILVTAFACIGCIFQVVGLLRYLVRLPDDWVGIGLYGASIFAFALIAVGFFLQWKKQQADI